MEDYDFALEMRLRNRSISSWKIRDKIILVKWRQFSISFLLIVHGADVSNSCCHRRPCCIEILWKWRREQGFPCGGMGIFHWTATLCSKREIEVSAAAERSELCSQKAECAVGMAAVGLKANPFIAFHILQYLFVFSYLSLKNRSLEENFLGVQGISKT